MLFCGINPGLYTAAIGHHFGRPGNRFWPTLFAAGFTERLLSPFEAQELLAAGVRMDLTRKLLAQERVTWTLRRRDEQAGTGLSGQAQAHSGAT